MNFAQKSPPFFAQIQYMVTCICLQQFIEKRKKSKDENEMEKNEENKVMLNDLKRQFINGAQK